MPNSPPPPLRLEHPITFRVPLAIAPLSIKRVYVSHDHPKNFLRLLGIVRIARLLDAGIASVRQCCSRTPLHPAASHDINEPSPNEILEVRPPFADLTELLQVTWANC